MNSRYLRKLPLDRRGAIAEFISTFIATVMIIVIVVVFILTNSIIKTISGSDGLKVKYAEEVGISDTQTYFGSFSNLVKLRVSVSRGNKFEDALSEARSNG
ncbi:hypothetical protein HN630_00860 [archaeon]|jgi:hypothetical protein|nr:hypothetical protein [archaeon]MBT7567436.1 hypothetical protein [archaeon]